MPSSSAGSDADAGKDDKEMVKDETVYVIAGADGSVQKIIVSDWIKKHPGKRLVQRPIGAVRRTECQGRRNLYHERRPYACLGCAGQ